MNSIKVANPTTFVRQGFFLRRALRNLEAAEPLSPLLSVLLGQRKPTVQKRSDAAPLQLIDENLNESQKEAVDFALSSQEVALIWGPPGTGVFRQRAGSASMARLTRVRPQARRRPSSKSSGNACAPNRACSSAVHPTLPSTTSSHGCLYLIQTSHSRSL